MANANTPRTSSATRYYQIPQWAKEAIGADEARRIARECFACAKAANLNFNQAVTLVEDQYEAAIYQEDSRYIGIVSQ